jgi:succinyl-diaminopimelate desuccinylase
MIGSGKIYGRGTADMKGAMACLILALQIIQKLKLIPKYNIAVLNCTDEEIGVYPGIRYLAEKGYVKGTVFCMDGVIMPIISIGSAGALDVIVESFGRSCHSGMNFLGINAIEETVPILVELMNLKKIVEERESKDIPGFPRFGTGEKRNMAPMFNLDIMHSGTKTNIVPDLCTLTINRRIIPDENVEDVKKEISEAIERGKAKSKLLDVKTTFIYDYPPMKVKLNAPNVNRMKKVMMKVQQITEDLIQPIGISGSTDMGFISQILNTNDIIFHGAGNPGSNSHGVNEYIKLNEVKTFIKELVVFLCDDL